MVKEFKLEDPGEGIHEAEIKELHVSQGDAVADGDPVLTVETDKAAVEVPSPFSGTVEEIRVEVGDIAKVGEVLMTYTESESEAPTRKQDSDSDKKSRETAEADEASKTKEETKDKARGSDDEGSGDDDRETKQSTAPEKKGPVPASPATRRLARELGVSLRSVEPSGPAGRVTEQDVRAAAGESNGDARPRKEEKPSRHGGVERDGARPEDSAALPDFSQWGEVERVPLRSVRRATAKRMALSWTQIPHVMHEDEVDITEIEHWRRRQGEAAEEQGGGKLTVTVLAIKALVAALKEFPRFNASLDLEEDEIVLKRHYHIGVAVATDQGLLVPVVRDADRKSLIELSKELKDLSDKARAGELSPEHMRGATFTLTNPGPLGGRVFTPIVDFPQVAILGLGQARLEAKVEGEIDAFEIRPRLMLPLCLAFDHRVNDGADAARFAGHISATLSDTQTMLLSV